MDSVLKYSLIRRNDFVVISFVGLIERSAKDVMKSCLDEIHFGSAFQHAILNLQQVQNLDYVGISELIRLQKVLRDQSSGIRICGLSPVVRALLDERGAVRDYEVVATLELAILQLSKAA